MTTPPRHPSDIFRTTASYYARYRPRYPEAFIEHLAGRFGLDGSGRLLDLGCGTGDLALPLAPWFHEVVAMDPEPEMLAEARRKADASSTANIRFVDGGSWDLERLAPELGVFRLVTMGESFHWMDRDAILATLYELIEPGGAIAVTWKAIWARVVESGASDVQPAAQHSDWPGEANDWLSIANRVVTRWLGERRRAGSGYYEVPSDGHERYIERSRFERMEVIDDQRFGWTQTRDVDGVIGWLYSTSYASPYVLGDRREAFEADLRRTLLALSPDGVFEEEVRIGAFLAWKEPAA